MVYDYFSTGELNTRNTSIKWDNFCIESSSGT